MDGDLDRATSQAGSDSGSCRKTRALEQLGRMRLQTGEGQAMLCVHTHYIVRVPNGLIRPLEIGFSKKSSLNVYINREKRQTP